MELRLISLMGLFVMMFLAWLMSSHKFRFPWRIAISGVVLQFLLATFVFHTTAGQTTFRLIGDFFTATLNFVDVGASFVFGDKFQDYFFAFKVLPTIIFFSSLMSVLYYLRVMQVLVKGMAYILQWTLRTSGAETLSAAANIFMGQTEAPLVVKPYIPLMTRSELNAVMVGGFSTISGSLLAVFAGMKIPVEHLVTASVISAPASLVIAKILVPETEEPKTLGQLKLDVPPMGTNVLEAAAIGASDGVKLAINVAAMLIAFLGLLAMIDKGISLTGGLLGYEWSLGLLFGYTFAPFAWLMGIESGDCFEAAELLGLKMVANEFVAYSKLQEWIAPGSDVQLSERSVMILTYALCGFSNFASIGIQIGGLGGMAPERQSELAQLGFRAMLGGTLACFMTACVAGILL
ncbi:Na+ dependent nucleoside transporter domain protein [Pirellula staleyi DSM 6068]|uniref:Nucleoside permease n=1 Tax=Pirellula staleyi (strain ATCC 27377 / DSM 6068 / ICPB 4128) TaxID=530564 RepID=D2QZE8_PIRSD|nr:NupC/NupG family nucleoside CNT transporter [Pirellula staleyi]ADB14706.1 Na+ dependent nucleoside transporter domain protein [Pirellula staleyi DSM 6068]